MAQTVVVMHQLQALERIPLSQARTNMPNPCLHDSHAYCHAEPKPTVQARAYLHLHLVFEPFIPAIGAAVHFMYASHV